MKILLAGGGGFAGYHLSLALKKRGHEVFIADRFNSDALDRTHLLLDLQKKSGIRSIFQAVKPDCTVHLAAQSSVALSWQEPDFTLETNVIGSVRLFQAAAETVPGSRFIFIGSGEEYGSGCTEENPFTEETVCRPRNPYAVSKFSAGQILALLAEKTGMRFVHLRPCNHFGPFQREGFAIADFCAQIARAEQGGCPVISVGNLSAKRDFLYVDDVISAYCLMVEADSYPHSLYNIATGSVRTLRYILDYLTAQAKIPLKVESDPVKFRPVEIPVLTASCALIEKDFHWRPEIPLEVGLTRNLDWWRARISAS